ncbi:hypothetical protein [Methylobacterium sp. CM6247]
MHIPSPRTRGEGRDDLVVVAARRQPKVRGRVRVSPYRMRTLTLASASPLAHRGHDKVSAILSRARGEAALPDTAALLQKAGHYGRGAGAGT